MGYLNALTFQGEPGVRKLVDAIEHFKEKDGAVDKSAPVGFLESEERVAVSKDGKFRVSLYKALLFLHVQNGIKSGALNLEHSYKYRPLDDYLLDRDRWQRDKQQLIERAELEAFVNPQRCSGSSTRPCTSSILRPTSTLPRRRIPTSNSRRTALQRASLRREPSAGISYAPRFKNLQCQRLYIFRNRKGVDRSTWKIKGSFGERGNKVRLA